MAEGFSYPDFFPYSSIRLGQDEMMQQIEDAVRKGRNICAEAPNGYGKTCVTLAGILPWMKENGGKALYCARTHRQLDRVIEELTNISHKAEVSGLSFRGRRHMCINKFVLENADTVAPISEVCGQLKATGKCLFYENAKRIADSELLFDLFPTRVLTAPEIADFAGRKELCPYEVAKILARAVDVIALSYLYVFDPFIMETFLPELKAPISKIILVQDEAHNVPSTALDSASGKITIGTIRQAMREGNTYKDEKTVDFCRGLAQAIIDITSEMHDFDEVIVNPREIYGVALNYAGLSEEDNVLAHLKDLGSKLRRSQLKAGKFPRSSIHRVGEFMLDWFRSCHREDYIHIVSSERSRESSRKVSIEHVALDPTAVTRNVLESVRCSVAISGTISPLEAYADMLGFDDQSFKASFKSPFSKSNRIAFVVDNIGTSYESRSEKMFDRMVDHCVKIVEATPGNTGIFTTSYGIAKSLQKAGLEGGLGKKLFVESPTTTGRKNDDMVREYKECGNQGGAVLLGVQGGRNSEGGDFPGPTMDTVVVVGVPYARPMPRIQALITYFDKKFQGKGRDYAYVLPAMTRAVQAAGRPVRRLDDKGVIVFLDHRFGTGYLKRFMPVWLLDVLEMIPDNPLELGQRIQDFFRRQSSD